MSDVKIKIKEDDNSRKIVDPGEVVDAVNIQYSSIAEKIFDKNPLFSCNVEANYSSIKKICSQIVLFLMTSLCTIYTKL